MAVATAGRQEVEIAHWRVVRLVIVARRSKMAVQIAFSNIYLHPLRLMPRTGGRKRSVGECLPQVTFLTL